MTRVFGMLLSSKAATLPLLLGIVLGLPILFAPIEEGYRNAQTAVLTAAMWEDGRLRLDPMAAWRGDLDARLVQELPVYNLLVLGLNAIPGMPLDTAGRLVSLSLWIFSFILLQFLWKWTLPAQARLWANLLFVLAPLNWYASTAFMPETLVQLLTIAFITLCLVYTKKQTAGICVALIVVAGLGLLVKLPAFVHLGLFATLVWVDRLGWRSLFRPIFIAGGLVLVACLVAWGRYADSVNSAYFDYWTGMRNLEGFIQPNVSRLSIHYYIPLALYNTVYLLGVVGLPVVVVGFWETLRRARHSFAYRMWIYLFASLVVYWLVWAKAAPWQNYYNLFNLVFLAAMFGLGFTSISRWLEAHGANRSARIALAMASIVTMTGFDALCWYHSSRPDTITVTAGRWLKSNTNEEDIILFQPRHHPSAMDYEHQPLLSHVSSRRTWIWTRSTPGEEKERALQTASYLVITEPPAQPSFFDRLRQKIKGAPPEPTEALAELHPDRFNLVAKGQGYTVFSNNLHDAE
jgi:hypothetical protein